MSIYSKLSSLLTAANNKTGESDTTLTDAVQTLIDGYGQGGGGYSMDDIIEHNFTGSVTYTGTTMRGGTFSGSGITEIHAPNITSYAGGSYSYTFQYCKSLTVVDFPRNLTFANASYIFGGCTSLESVYFPLVNTSGSFMFQDCDSLKYVVMPMIKTINNSLFHASNSTHSANHLLVFDCGDPSRASNNNVTFGDRGFNDQSCQTIIIRQTILALLQNSGNNYMPTNFHSGGSGGTIYIPKVLYDHLGDGSSLDYKAATNWSVYDGYGTITWAKIEGSYYETHYADGTVIPT